MNLTRRHLWPFLTLAGAVPAAAQDSVKTGDAWARPTVAGQSAGGGYLRISGGAAPDKLLGASTSLARSVELHEMRMNGTTMQMRALEAIEVPARQTVELKPGGQHLMLVGLVRPLKVGESFALTLRFERAGDMTVPVKVAAAAPAAASAHKH